MRDIIKKFKEYLKNREDKNDYKIKKEMCERAIKSNMCPNFCHHCAWNTGVFKNE